MSSKAELNQKTPCILEIGDKGIKMIDKSKPGVNLTILWLQPDCALIVSGRRWRSSITRIFLQPQKRHILRLPPERPQILRVYNKGIKTSDYLNFRNIIKFLFFLAASGSLYPEVRLPCVCQWVLHEMCSSGLRVSVELRSHQRQIFLLKLFSQESIQEILPEVYWDGLPYRGYLSRINRETTATKQSRINTGRKEWLLVNIWNCTIKRWSDPPSHYSQSSVAT